MRKFLATALSLGLSTASCAQPAVVTVMLSSFKFAPASISLRAGAPVTLHIQNSASGGHNFSAREFFAAAKVDPRSAGLVHGGTVEIPSRSAVDITLIPAAGQYQLRCTHFLHASFGMKGTILVR